MYSHIMELIVIKPGTRRPQARAWFLRIAFVREVSMCVYMCVDVCVSAPRGY